MSDRDRQVFIVSKKANWTCHDVIRGDYFNRFYQVIYVCDAIFSALSHFNAQKHAKIKKGINI